MTNLTEQWKKGKLPSGWYYVRLIRGEYRIDLYISDKNEWIDCPDNIIDTVVCEVPSYELWKAVHEQWKVLLEENAQLKELLKTHMLLFELEKDNTKDALQQGKYAYLIDEIDQVIGEE